MQADLGNMEIQQDESLKYQTYRKSSCLAEVYLLRKSKVTWLKLGDDNTKYSHFVIKHRKLHLSTTQLGDDRGDWKNDPELVAQVCVDYYTDLLGKAAPTRVKVFPSCIQNDTLLTIDHLVDLVKPFTGQEVKSAIFKINSNKSPGPGGYGSCFSKATWDIVGRDITEAVMDYFPKR